MDSVQSIYISRATNESINPKGKNEIFGKHFHSFSIYLECTYTQHINIVADAIINILPKSE